jgi:hypothetical protein
VGVDVPLALALSVAGRALRFPAAGAGDGEGERVILAGSPRIIWCVTATVPEPDATVWEPARVLDLALSVGAVEELVLRAKLCTNC